ITLPQAPPPHDEILAYDKPAENTAAAETEKPGAGITVLVAEDHPVNRKLLTVFLEKAGAAVIQAEDGQEAVEAIQAHPVDVIFMDIQMPRMNGYEAAVWMRNKGHTVPIIACTASAQQDEKEKCLDCGMNDVLPKPYKRQDVIDMMITYGRQYKETQQHNALTGVADDHRPNAAAPERMAPDPEVFDPFFFSDIMMGDLESAKALIGEYLEQTESHLAILAEDLASGNSNAASQTAHLIKGSSLNITAKRLADAAEKIEHAGSVLTNEQKHRLLAEVHTEFGRLGKALAAEGYR
ncbi:MAG: response regulator, partial [Treponema sp.]